MIANTGIFLVGASRALSHVDVNTLRNHLAVCLGLDADDQRNGITLGQGRMGEQDAITLGEAQLGGITAAAANTGYNLSSGRNGLIVFPEEGDAHLAIILNKKFKMRLHRVDNFATIGAGLGAFMRVSGVLAMVLALVGMGAMILLRVKGKGATERQR